MTHSVAYFLTDVEDGATRPIHILIAVVRRVVVAIQANRRAQRLINLFPYPPSITLTVPAQ